MVLFLFNSGLHTEKDNSSGVLQLSVEIDGVPFEKSFHRGLLGHHFKLRQSLELIVHFATLTFGNRHVFQTLNLMSERAELLDSSNLFVE